MKFNSKILVGLFSICLSLNAVANNIETIATLKNLSEKIKNKEVFSDITVSGGIEALGRDLIGNVKITFSSSKVLGFYRVKLAQKVVWNNGPTVYEGKMIQADNFHVDETFQRITFGFLTTVEDLINASGRLDHAVRYSKRELVFEFEEGEEANVTLTEDYYNYGYPYFLDPIKAGRHFGIHFQARPFIFLGIPLGLFGALKRRQADHDYFEKYGLNVGENDVRRYIYDIRFGSQN